MKKSVCLMAILGAFVASGAMAATQVQPTDHNQTVSVKFTGSVIDSNCVITAGDGTSVNLGTYNLQKKTAPIVPVTFTFTGCENAKAVASVTLKSDGGAYPQKGNVANHVLSTNQKGLTIQLYKDLSGTTEGMAEITKDGKNTLVAGEGKVTVAYAQLKDAKDTVAKGPVEGLATFDVTFN